MPPEPPRAVEELARAIFIDGQRCDVFVRTQREADGTWHNALLFRRGGRVMAREFMTTGVDWHVAPDAALERARGLEDAEVTVLFERSMRGRGPVV